jgi:hypothetical protein
LHELTRPVCAPDRAPEAIDEVLREETDMVDMGVGKEDGIDLFQSDRERVQVVPSLGILALKKTAIDKDVALL